MTLACTAVCVALAAPEAAAQSYPVKPIRIVVGFPAGSGPDLVARTIGQRLSGYLGQPAVIENRTGAAGTIATGFVAAAAPDGHTLLQVTAAETVVSLPLRRRGARAAGGVVWFFRFP